MFVGFLSDARSTFELVRSFWMLSRFDFPKEQTRSVTDYNNGHRNMLVTRATLRCLGYDDTNVSAGS
jgi:hypothetical protein